MLKNVLIVLVVLITGFLAFAATRPDTFAVQRSVTINAPAEKVFPLVNSLRNFNRWSPFMGKDPQVKGTYSGPEAGPGAAYAWQGNSDVGQGSMTISEAQAPRHVAIDLQFTEPFAARNKVDFTLLPAGAATQVTWSMNGPSPFISKVIGVVFSMDRMVGSDFEKGLASLKALAEKGVP